VPQYDAKVRAVVLLDEERVLVEEGGRVTTTRLRAVRILSREGNDEARGRVIYQTGTGKVKEMRGWIIWPAGGVRSYGKDRVMDTEVAPYDVYNDVRARAIVASDEAAAGAVFGYEAVLEDKSVFTQFEWQFQERLPVLASRFSISVPPAWRVNGILYNHPGRSPAVAGTSYTWELRDLPPIEPEAASPAVTSIAPWLAVSVVPTAGGRTGIGKTFDTWQDVARWLSELSETQTSTSDALAEKARSLVQDSKSEYDKVGAIGRYVQTVKYVSIQTGVGRGGGYRPHAAPEVFAKSYGDCKDKANLMRTMLRVVGVEAYTVAVFFGDPARVRPDWPSPQQFNHAIVAVHLKEELQVPAVGSYSHLGRFLFFDPTDEDTPPGSLPQDEEGSLGLLVSRDRGALLPMPTTPPEANRIVRHLELTLAGDGTLVGTVEERAHGHPASAYRREHQHKSAAEYRKSMESRLGRSGPGTQMRSLEVADDPDGSVRTVAEFDTPRYAQSIGRTGLLVKPNVLPIPNRMYLSEPQRKYAVVLNSQSFEETTRMRLPDGFFIDEIPGPIAVVTAFGAHSSSCRLEDVFLTCRRSLTVTAGTIPVERYEEARRFFAGANGCGEEPVLLARKRGGPPR